MPSYHRVVFLGSPGSGKSMGGLSYPGVEQHVFGSSEEDTALSFVGRKDILPPVKMLWQETLKPEEQAKLVDEKTSELEVGRLTEIARMRNIIRYRRYLRKLDQDLRAGKREELKTVFLDNFTPFSEDFQDYIQHVYERDLTTEQGNFNSIKFAIKYNQELVAFLRDFVSLPCHTIMSCHIAMTIDEEAAASSNFMKDAAKGIKIPKEWQAYIMGKTKYAFAGIFNHAFFLFTEEAAGQATKYYAKLEADSSNVGIAKGRVQPYLKPNRLQFGKGTFYKEFEEALKRYRESGKQV